jgi:hypothetical protein
LRQENFLGIEERFRGELEQTTKTLSMTKQITNSYFPKGLKYFTPLAFVGGIYLLVLHEPFWGALFILLGIIILTTKYVTKISLIEKKYEDYLSLLGLKLNYDSKKFKKVDRIVITKGSFSQNVIQPRYKDRPIKWSTYTGTLIFDNDTLDLLATNNKKDLLHKLKKFTTFLQIGVEDRTTNQNYWIDMTKV